MDLAYDGMEGKNSMVGGANVVSFPGLGPVSPE